MTTYAFPIMILQENGSGEIIGVSQDTMTMLVPDGVNSFTYTIVGTDADGGWLIEADTGDLLSQIGGVDMDALIDFPNAEIGIIEISWDSGTKTAWAFLIYDNTNNTTYAIPIGGDELPDNLNTAAAFNAWLATTVIGNPSPGSGFEEGDVIPFAGINHITSTEDDTYEGSGGPDDIDLGAGNDTLSGLDGDDTLRGGEGNDSILGGNDNDTIYDGPGQDTLNGGPGDDIFMNGGGTDTFNGGSGSDTLVTNVIGVPNQENVIFNTVTGEHGRESDPSDLLQSVENFTLIGDWDAIVTGGNEANVFTLGDGNDLVNGGGNADTLIGGGGNDTLIGGAGADDLQGGDGTDTASYETSTARVWVDLQNDALMRGDAIGDTFDSIEIIRTGDYADQIRGDANDNEFYGGTRSDRLYGRAGDDILDGEGGADAIYGNAGADTMSGGDDNLRDRFIYFNISESGVGAGNRDVITDFDSGEDRIEIRRFDADTTTGGKQGFNFIGDAAFSNTAGELRYVKAGGITVIQADTNGDGVADFEIELTGEMDLDAGDFLI